MTQEDSSPLRLVSNAAVHDFYSRLQAYRCHSTATTTITTKSLDSNTHTTSASDPLNLETDDMHTTVDSSKQEQEGSVALNKPTDPKPCTPDRDQASKEAPVTTAHQKLSSESNKNKNSSQPARSIKAKSKAIPRKEFMAIKKKLRKRELRRRNAVEGSRIRAIEVARKPKYVAFL
jgi:hypothetical protein